VDLSLPVLGRARWIHAHHRLRPGSRDRGVWPWTDRCFPVEALGPSHSQAALARQQLAPLQASATPDMRYRVGVTARQALQLVVKQVRDRHALDAGLRHRGVDFVDSSSLDVKGPRIALCGTMRLACWPIDACTVGASVPACPCTDRQGQHCLAATSSPPPPPRWRALATPVPCSRVVRAARQLVRWCLECLSVRGSTVRRRPGNCASQRHSRHGRP
jgi:hypothetical protein